MLLVVVWTCSHSRCLSATTCRPCSEAAHGGQVIVSEKAWAAVQDQLPGQPHVSACGMSGTTCL